jgi:hypothetical protein
LAVFADRASRYSRLGVAVYPQLSYSRFCLTEPLFMTLFVGAMCWYCGQFVAAAVRNTSI